MPGVGLIPSGRFSERTIDGPAYGQDGYQVSDMARDYNRFRAANPNGVGVRAIGSEANDSAFLAEGGLEIIPYLKGLASKGIRLY